MRRVTYQAAICGEEGKYGVVFPDVGGCTSAGATLDEAAAMAHEALEAHLAIGVEYGDPFPEPGNHTLADIAADFARDVEPGDPEETWVKMIPVTVDVPEARDTVQLDVPETLVREIDAVTSDRRTFLVSAARRELIRIRQAGRKTAA